MCHLALKENCTDLGPPIFQPKELLGRLLSAPKMLRKCKNESLSAILETIVMPETPQSEIVVTMFFGGEKPGEILGEMLRVFSCFARCAELRKKLLPKVPAIYHSVS